MERTRIITIQFGPAPVRLSRYGGGPEHITLPKIGVVDATRTGATRIIGSIHSPSATGTVAVLVEVHLCGKGCVLNHCTETNEGTIRVRFWRVLHIERRDLQGSRLSR